MFHLDICKYYLGTKPYQKVTSSNLASMLGRIIFLAALGCTNVVWLRKGIGDFYFCLCHWSVEVYHNFHNYGGG